MDDDSDTGALPPAQPRQIDNPGSPSRHGRTVADDENSGDKPDQLKKEEEDSDDIFGRLAGATADVLSKKVGLLALQPMCSFSTHQFAIQSMACGIRRRRTECASPETCELTRLR